MSEGSAEVLIMVLFLFVMIGLPILYGAIKGDFKRSKLSEKHIDSKNGTD